MNDLRRLSSVDVRTVCYLYVYTCFLYVFHGWNAITVHIGFDSFNFTSDTVLNVPEGPPCWTKNSRTYFTAVAVVLYNLDVFRWP